MKSLTIYLIIEIISLFFMSKAENSYKKEKKNQKSKNKLLVKKSTALAIISAIPLILLVGFRGDNVGIDTHRVAQAYERIVSNNMYDNDIQWLGYGYTFFIKSISLIFGSNYVVLNTIIATLTIFFLYKAIWDNAKNKTLSLYLFFSSCLLYQMMNQSRQQLAIMIVLFGFKYIKKRDFKKYFIIILLAFCVHKSALIMLPFYFISNNELNKKNIFLYFLIATMIVVFEGYVEKLLLYTDYGQTYILSGIYNDTTKAYYNLIVRIGLLLFALAFKDKEDKEEKYLYNMGIWCVISQVITSKVYAFGRITTYFFIFFILLLPNSIEKFSNRFNNKRYINLFIIVLFFIYHIGYYILTGQLRNDYHTFLY